MKSEAEMLKTATNAAITISNEVPKVLAATVDEFLNQELPFEKQLQNTEIISNLKDLLEEFVDELSVSEDTTPLDFIKLIEAKLTNIRSQLTYLGNTPEISKECRTKLLKMIVQVNKTAVEVWTYGRLIDCGILKWVNWCCLIDETTITPFEKLWISYYNQNNGHVAQQKTFAQLLKSIGLKPSVKNINGKSTRVYTGIKLIEGTKTPSRGNT